MVQHAEESRVEPNCPMLWSVQTPDFEPGQIQIQIKIVSTFVWIFLHNMI